MRLVANWSFRLATDQSMDNMHSGNKLKRLLTFVACCALSALSCRGVVREQIRSPYEFAGVIVQPNGDPAADSVVIISDPSTTDEIDVTRTDGAGHFRIGSTVSTVALSATTHREFALLPHLKASERETIVHLQPACSPVLGRVEVDDPSTPVDIIRLGNFSETDHGVFGLAVSPQGRFSACLPEDNYYAELPKRFANRVVLTKVPSPDPLIIHVTSNEYASSGPRALLNLGPVGSQEFLTRSAAGARVIGLGESNHGTRDFVLEQAAISLDLARSYDFDIIMMEGGYGEVIDLERYVSGQEVDIRAAIRALGYWTWNTPSFLSALDQLRAYNQSVSVRRRVHLVGIDIQSTEGAVNDLLGDPALITEEEAVLVERLRNDSGKQWAQFTPGDRQRTRAMLGRIANVYAEGGVYAPTNRHALAARSLLLQLGYREQVGFWELFRFRNHALAELAEDVMKRAPEARGTMWCHMGHLAREFVAGSPTAGRVLTDTFGSGYRVYALLANSGAARAWGPDPKLGVIVHSLAPAPLHIVEGTLAGLVPAPLPQVTFWLFDSPDATTQRWFHELHWIRSFGSNYDGEKHPYDLYAPAAFDGAILLKTVSPSEPLKQ